MTENLPKFINKVFLQEVLSSYKNDATIDVQSFTVTSNFSEHFSSSMFQCSIDFTTQNSIHSTVKVVVKVLPQGEKMKSNFVGRSVDRFFSTEVKMYKETIPEIKRLFQLHGLADDLTPE
jgi:hypothetical protein